MADRGRSKSRGRARPPSDQKSQQQEQPSSAWGRRPGPPSQAGPSQTPYSRPPAPPQSGLHSSVKGLVKSATRDSQRPGPRGDVVPGPSRSSGPEKMDVTPSGGGDTVSVGRGAMRGGRALPSDILVTRPKNLATKNGTTGSRVMLQANYFKLQAVTDWCLYQYRVDFSPEEDRTAIRKGLLRLHKSQLGAYIFDGTVMYTSHRLPEKLELLSIRQSDEAKITINIKFVGDMAKGDHHYLQFFNIIMRKCLEHLQLQPVGRNFFDARNKVEIREFRLELWPGYLTSIRQHERDILMCAEITHKVMRQQTLLDMLTDCYNEGGDFKRRYVEQVVGLVVLTDYNNNTYRIDDVDFDVRPDSTFTLRTGDNISYKDYYLNKYQIHIANRSQPMLVTRTKPKDRRAGQGEFVYLVPELCRPTGLTDNMRGNFHLMRALADHTRVSPDARINKLMMFNRRLHSEPKIIQEFSEWNLKLDQKLVDLPARILPQERIFFGRDANVLSGPRVDWTNEFRSKQMFTCRALENWILICTEHVAQDVERKLLHSLSQVTRSMAFNISRPRIVTIRDDRSGTYTAKLEEIMSRSNPELIFCVVSNNRSDRYAAIKKKCCIDRPVPTQVFLQKNLHSKGLMSIVTKVAIQLNCKLGGAPWCVDIPITGLMVVGFDVCHDTVNRSQDHGAMVASIDKNLTRYYSTVIQHKSGEELSNELSVNICKALHKYRELNNALPARILIYRDGVGEGQIPYVYEHEVEHIKSKLATMYGDPNLVRMAFVLVTKRMNTRFFLNRENPPPGTVIDDVVTNPVKYDFFIIPQSVRQGTVTPTAFSVLSDNIGLDADKLQRLTYKLTHMYFNWSGTVRVPAPCQYAHKLAFLAANSIHATPSAHLDTLLFFL